MFYFAHCSIMVLSLLSLDKKQRKTEEKHELYGKWIIVYNSFILTFLLPHKAIRR